MRKGLKILLIFIIIILLTFIFYLTYYRYKLNSPNDLGYSDNYILSDKINITYDIDYENEYQEKIENDNIKSKEYFVLENDKIIYGEIYIGADEKLYLNDRVNNLAIKIIEDKKFMGLKEQSNVHSSGFSVYALSTDGSLYLISLNSINIKNVDIEEIKLESTVKKFTSLKLENFNGGIDYINVVLLENGKMVDVNFGIPYNEKTINVKNEYLILENRTIINYDGKVICNSDNSEVKIKSIIYIENENKAFKYNPNIMFVTENNKIIYTLGDMIIEYEKDILNVENNKDNIIIYFKDKTKFELTGYYYEDI